MQEINNKLGRQWSKRDRVEKAERLFTLMVRRAEVNEWSVYTGRLHGAQLVLYDDLEEWEGAE